MSGEYRFLFGNWQTARVDIEIPLYGVYIVGKLNDVGYMQGSFQLDQEGKSGKSNAELIEATVPFRNFIVIVRNGQPVWGGYITSRTYQAQSKSLQIYAKAYEGYYDERIVPKYELGSGGLDFFEVDQGMIFYFGTSSFHQINATHAGPLYPLFFIPENSNVPFGPELIPSIPYSGPITGVNKTYQVLRRDYTTYRQMVDSIANSDDGFDWRIVPRFVIGQSVILGGTGGFPDSPTYVPLPGSPYEPLPAVEVHKFVLFGYPTLSAGLSGDSTIFEYPGNILNYYRTDNLSGAGTGIIGIGAGQGFDMLVSEILNTDLIDVRGGFIPRDVVIPLKHIEDQGILDARVAQENIKRKPPKVTYKVDVRPELTPEFGTYDLGSAATLIIRDPMHPEGIRVPVTINEYTLRPASSEGGAEEISLGFVGDFE